MFPRRSRWAPVPLIFALWLTACRAPVGRSLPSIEDPFARSIPDISTRGGRVWFAQRSQPVGAYALELDEPMPLQFRPRHAVRFFVLRGRVRVRVLGAERTLESGGYASVPPGAAYRIMPLDREPPRLLLALSPDGGDPAVVEIVGNLRRLAPSSR